MNKVTRISITAASTASLVVGFAGIVGASPVSTLGTGHGSQNTLRDDLSVNTDINNNARVRAVTNNPQYAESGNATSDNTTVVSDTQSGNAQNLSDTAVTVRVHTSGLGTTNLDSPSANASDDEVVIGGTGDNAETTVTRNRDIRQTTNNSSDIEIVNNNSQTAISGNARAINNTAAGSVRSGAVRNDSFTTTDVNLTY